MRNNMITKGFDVMRRLVFPQLLWRDDRHYYSYLTFFLFFLFIGCDCKDDTTGPKPPEEYTYTWTVDTLVFNLSGYRAPNSFVVQSIWGSSSHDVWAVSPSDVPWGELWHYNGNKWSAVQWPWIGTDEIGLYGGYLYATTGFDSNNVFFFGAHNYNDSATASVMKWNGSSWSDLPWKEGRRPWGGLGWGVKQNNNKLWAIAATGIVIKYENGFLSTDSKLTDDRVGTAPVIATLDNGEVYVNVYKDSLDNGSLRGSITKLFKRDLIGNWSLVEEKFIAGDYYDNNGLGRGVYSSGNRLFTGNYGLWERSDTTWIKRFSLYDLGAWCLPSNNELWVAFKLELYHYNGKTWNKISIPTLLNSSDIAFYGCGWSDGNDIFLGFRNSTKSFILHGKKTLK